MSSFLVAIMSKEPSAAPWHGVFPAATTHFHPDQSLDIEGTLRHNEAMLKAGIHGLVMLGTVGENSSLEPSEKLDVLRATVEATARRVPVLTGVAEHTTSGACRFAEKAKAAGVDGLMVLPAMVYKSDPRETVAHLRAVARAPRLPLEGKELEQIRAVIRRAIQTRPKLR